MAGKESELVWEMGQCHLDIVGLTSMLCTGTGTKLMEQGGLSFSGVTQGERRWASVGILASRWLSAGVLELSWGMRG